MISFFEWVQESSWTYNCRKCINPADAAASPCVQRQHENLCETSVTTKDGGRTSSTERTMACCSGRRLKSWSPCSLWCNG